jgi:hypothetical protein
MNGPVLTLSLLLRSFLCLPGNYSVIATLAAQPGATGPSSSASAIAPDWFSRIFLARMIRHHSHQLALKQGGSQLV